MSLRLATATALTLALAAPALAAERFVIRGDDAHIWNLAGRVVVEAGTGPDVVVLVERGGRDGGRLRIATEPLRGKPGLRVIYGADRIIYRSGDRGRFRSTTRVSADGTWDGRGNWMGKRVTVESHGRGMEAHADLRVQVPRGRSVSVHHYCGEMRAESVSGNLLLDGGSTWVTTSETEGALSIDVGSGGVRVDGHAGSLTVDTGSGHVAVARVKGNSLHLDTGSGGVEVSSVVSDRVLVDTGSGRVRLEGIATSDLTVDTGSGAVDVSLLRDRTRVSIDTGSGGVRVAVPEHFSADVSIETGSGGITAVVPLTVYRKDRDMLHGRLGDGGPSMRIETGSGGVQLVRSR